MRIVGHSDQGGRPDGVQVMVHRGFAYVGHMFSKGFSVIDVRDAKNPRAVNYVAAPANTWNIHLQVHDDLLLVIHAKDMFAAAEFADERAYYSGALGKTVGTAEAKRTRDWSAGLAVYDISQAGGAASYRLHACRGRRHPPRLVHRRAVGLRVGAARRLHRLYLHDHRHERAGTAARSGTLVDPGHEFGAPARRRHGPPRAVTGCITRSFMATPLMPPGAMPAWWCSILPTAAGRNRSYTGIGHRRSAAARTIVCRFRIAISWLCWTKLFSIIKKTD